MPCGNLRARVVARWAAERIGGASGGDLVAGGEGRGRRANRSVEGVRAERAGEVARVPAGAPDDPRRIARGAIARVYVGEHLGPRVLQRAPRGETVLQKVEVARRVDRRELGHRRRPRLFDREPHSVEAREEPRRAPGPLLVRGLPTAQHEVVRRVPLGQRVVEAAHQALTAARSRAAAYGPRCRKDIMPHSHVGIGQGQAPRRLSAWRSTAAHKR